MQTVAGAFGQKLRRRTFEHAVHALEPQQAHRARALGDRLDLVHLLARQRRAAGNANAAHAAARVEHDFRHRELGASKDVAHVLDLEAVAQIGAIDAVALHRVGVRHAAHASFGKAAPALDPQRADHLLGDVDDVVLRHERRLDVDLRELRLAVGAQILVAKAAGDLEVAVVARDHQQLLVDLRRLRQRVELAGMHATRHEVVARALGRGLRENRRLDLEEAGVGEKATRALQQPMPQHQVALQLVAAEIEVAVLETQLLRGKRLVLAARDGNGRRLRRPDDAERRGAHLDGARAHVGVSHRLRTLGDRALDDDDCLGAERRRACADVGASRARVEGHLHQTCPIAKIDEHQSAEIARPMNPASKPHCLTNVFNAKCAAGMRTKARGERRLRHYEGMKWREHSARVAKCLGMRDDAATAPGRTTRGLPPVEDEGGRYRWGINACAGGAFNRES